MLRPRNLAAVAAALVVAGCASDPYYYGETRYQDSRYAAAPGYYGGAYSDVGRVVAIDVVRGPGGTSGGGAVAGAIVGGVLGHQIGSGRGNTVATIAGAGLGAVAGNQIEKNTKTKTMWSVAIRMDNGAVRTFNYSNQPAVGVGDRVKLMDGGKRLALVAP